MIIITATHTKVTSDTSEVVSEVTSEVPSQVPQNLRVWDDVSRETSGR